MHRLFKGKREDRRPEYAVIGAGVVMGAAAGLGAPPGLANHLAPQTTLRHTSHFVRHPERVAESKEGARHFIVKVLALLKGGGEAIPGNDSSFEDVEVTRGNSDNKEEGVCKIKGDQTPTEMLMSRVENAPKPELFDFSQQDTALSTQDVVEGIGQATEHIEMYTSSGIVIRKALLDTGMEPNMICRTIAEESQLSIKEYTGYEAQTADGRTFMPEGVVTLSFSFCDRGTAKSYRVDFLVAPETAPFDIALGREFIRRAQVFIKNPAGYVVHFPKETEGTSLHYSMTDFK